MNLDTVPKHYGLGTECLRMVAATLCMNLNRVPAGSVIGLLYINIASAPKA
jgi:hypothetical protein